MASDSNELSTLERFKKRRKRPGITENEQEENANVQFAILQQQLLQGASGVSFPLSLQNLQALPSVGACTAARSQNSSLCHQQQYANNLYENQWRNIAMTRESIALSPPSTPTSTDIQETSKINDNCNNNNEAQDYDEENAYVEEGSLDILNQLRHSRDDNNETNTEMDKETLIEEIRMQPVLWNLKSSGYKDASKKKLAWQIIYEAMGKKYTVGELKVAWKGLREGYTRCKTKRKAASKSGSRATRLPTCNFFEQLEFLSDTAETSSQSTSNLGPTTVKFNTEISNETPMCSTPYRESYTAQKSRNNGTSDVEKAIISSLNNVDSQIKKVSEDSVSEGSSPNALFCKSLVSILDDLAPEDNMLARIKIQQLLFDIKYKK